MAEDYTPIGLLKQIRTLLTSGSGLPTGAATSAKQDTIIANLARASSTSRILSAAATTNATVAKASAGTVLAIQGYVARATPVYLKFYNKATAPTVGTDTPVKTIYLPALAAFAIEWPTGYSFATGIAYALTTGSADNDTGALTAADVLGLNVDYV